MSGDVLKSVIKASYGRKLVPMEDAFIGLLIEEMKDVKPRDERKRFNLAYNGLVAYKCSFNKLFLLHRVLKENLMKHIKQARNAMENC